MDAAKRVLEPLFLLTALAFVHCKSPPNIVFILADDLGFHDIGYHDNNVVKTPNLDALAGAGVKLENYYVQPTCTPTRSQLMSGRYQIHTGLQHGIIWSAQPNCLPLEDPTVAEKLQEAGYATHVVGKWHLGFYKRACWPTNRGFNSFFGFLGGNQGYSNHISRGGGPYRFAKNWQGLDLRDNLQPAKNYSGIYSTHLFAMRAQDVIRQHDRSMPLFLYVPFQAVHGPLKVPKKYEQQYANVSIRSRRVYAGMTTCMDEAVGNITSTLKEQGLWNNTVLVFSTDNGGDTNKGSSNWPLRGGKGSHFEGGIRAVGFVSSPLLPADVRGTISRELIHVSDWFPTLVQGLAGHSLNGTNLDGFNVWNTISSRLPSPREELVYNIDPMGHRPEVCNDTRSKFSTYIRAAIRYKDWKLITGYPGSSRWIPPAESGLAPIIPDTPKGKCVWLFNITDDPSERLDRSSEQVEVVDFLLGRLQHYQETAVPVRFPDGDPDANPALHDNVWDSWE
ncbi:arylsulfatase B-like [Diadema antillarum]|uniref:arylsulfatase B-like n=1 Tax=Diadema antillarum TaxID=105358 RepID=UPI003A8B4552